MPKTGGEAMQFIDIREGDILLYRKGGHVSEALIDFGEELEDGIQAREYYHVAVACNSQLKIEANGFEPVCITNIIDDGTFDVFRPQIPISRIRDGLYALRKLEGQKYDWWTIADEALRDLTFNLIHLPENFINDEERRRKICSTLVAFYFRKCEWGVLKRWPKPSPEDIYLLVKEYQVK